MQRKPRRNSTTQLRLRRQAAAMLPCPCWRCGRTVTAEMLWDADHIHAIAEGGAETGQVVPSHRSCNRKHGQRLKTQRENAHKQGSKPVRPLENKRITWW